MTCVVFQSTPLALVCSEMGQNEQVFSIVLIDACRTQGQLGLSPADSVADVPRTYLNQCIVHAALHGLPANAHQSGRGGAFSQR